MRQRWLLFVTVGLVWSACAEPRPATGETPTPREPQAQTYKVGQIWAFAEGASGTGTLIRQRGLAADTVPLRYDSRGQRRWQVIGSEGQLTRLEAASVDGQATLTMGQPGAGNPDPRVYSQGAPLRTVRLALDEAGRINEAGSSPPGDLEASVAPFDLDLSELFAWLELDWWSGATLQPGEEWPAAETRGEEWLAKGTVRVLEIDPGGQQATLETSLAIELEPRATPLADLTVAGTLSLRAKTRLDTQRHRVLSVGGPLTWTVTYAYRDARGVVAVANLDLELEIEAVPNAQAAVAP